MKKPLKQYNGGQWTEARMRSFVMSALRKARWPVKYAAIKTAYVENGVNPATGRKCKLHRCVKCGGLFPANVMQADHIEPVVPLDGEWGDTTRYLGYNWNELIPRLFGELSNFQVLCKPCHKEKSGQEKAVRAEFKREKKKADEVQEDMFE